MNELLLNLGPPNMLMKKRAFTLTFDFMCIHDCSISTCFLWFREKLFFILKKRSTYYKHCPNQIYTNKIPDQKEVV